MLQGLRELKLYGNEIEVIEGLQRCAASVTLC